MRMVQKMRRTIRIPRAAVFSGGSNRGSAVPAIGFFIPRSSIGRADAGNKRIQVFKPDGTFVKEFIVAPATRGGWGATIVWLRTTS